MKMIKYGKIIYCSERYVAIFKSVLERESLFLLEDLTVHYLQSFVKVFGKDDIIPKQHFMIHYARQMRLHGPLKQMWYMRFEAK